MATLPKLDVLDLYDLCVAQPENLWGFLTAAHGNHPKTLREDFAGTAALCRHAVASQKDLKAVAVDVDPIPLQRAAGVARLTLREMDVMDAKDKADIIAATNFSVCQLHSRSALVAYLKHARSCLKRGGVLVMDTYGGTHAQVPGRHTMMLKGAGGETVNYTFDQQDVDPFSGRVLNAIHFSIQVPGQKTQHLKDAFILDWRLWTVPELQDAARDAGFTKVEVHDREHAAVDAHGALRAPRPGAVAQGDWVALVVARA